MPANSGPGGVPQTEAPFSLGGSKDGMDPLLLGSVGLLVAVLGFIIYRLLRLQTDEAEQRRRTDALLAMADQDGRNEQREAQMAGGRRRGNVRRRVNHDEEDDGFARQMLAQQNGEPDEMDDDDVDMRYDDNGVKIGKKKAEKLAAKADKKAHREYEQHEREERKKREAEKAKQYDEEREREKQSEEAEEARLKKEKEEKEKREMEEYLAIKSSFAVEEEGFDQLEGEEAENLVRDFVEYVQKSKVVNMDELAAHFGLKADAAVHRLQHFLDEGIIQGVMDDRGKFIYITEDELQAVAKFVNQRGRVSIQELAEYSNKLIRLDGSDE